jgi:hypothetical protein
MRDVKDKFPCIMNMPTESTSQTTSHCRNWWAHERPRQRASGQACGPPRQRVHNRARRRKCGRACEQAHAERVDKRAAQRVDQARAGHVNGRPPTASTGVRPSEWTGVRPSTWTSAFTERVNRRVNGRVDGRAPACRLGDERAAERMDGCTLSARTGVLSSAWTGGPAGGRARAERVDEYAAQRMDRHATERMDGRAAERVGGRARSVRTDRQPSTWMSRGRARGQVCS